MASRLAQTLEFITQCIIRRPEKKNANMSRFNQDCKEISTNFPRICASCSSENKSFWFLFSSEGG